MWQETKHGLYKQFNFKDFHDAWQFMTQVATLAEQRHHHPRWENEWSVVQIWLITHESGGNISEKDHEMAKLIDGLLAEDQLVVAEKVADSLAVQHNHVKLYGDGGSRGNPGHSASGYVVLDMADNILLERGVYLGITTNNVAEYTALKFGLAAVRELGVKQVDVYMDSMLVVNQMKGIFKIKNRDLWPIHDAIVQELKSFQHVSFTHVPRELNKLADAAVNRALDEELGITHNHA